MQFNAVVATNASAIHLYEKLGFVRLGVIPKGYKKNAWFTQMGMSTLITSINTE